MTELEKKDEILKLLTKALIIAIDDDVNLTLRGNRVYVDYGCSKRYQRNDKTTTN